MAAQDKGDEKKAKRLADALKAAGGNFACVFKDCTCKGFIPRISNPSTCKNCGHAIDLHL